VSKSKSTNVVKTLCHTYLRPWQCRLRCYLRFVVHPNRCPKKRTKRITFAFRS